jgi:hypothetical protein
LHPVPLGCEIADVPSCSSPPGDEPWASIRMNLHFWTGLGAATRSKSEQAADRRASIVFAVIIGVLAIAALIVVLMNA